MEDGVLVSVGNQGARKPSKRVTKRAKEKDLRYTDKNPSLDGFVAPCGHKDGRFRCGILSKCLLVQHRAKVYGTLNKTTQDQKLSNYMHISTPKRSRARFNAEKKQRRPHSMQVSYEILTTSATRTVVCQKFFSAFMGITTRRLNTIAKTKMDGNICAERRGGDRTKHKSVEKRQKIKAFLSQLRARESHYNRNKSKRIYLPSHLNISKLRVMYNNSVNRSLQVKHWMFSNVFMKSFNIGFGSPATDVCSYCSRLKNEIKAAALDVPKKEQAMIELRVHKLRAKHFYKMMKESDVPVDKTISLCFDLQQVQVLPKVPIGEAFYSRQLAFYALCIVNVKGNNPTFYTWTENMAGRGANEVASALYQHLSVVQFAPECKNVRLFADSCAGQNKNNHVLHALMTWLLRAAPDSIQSVTLIFPVRGHSYLPADRVFGRVEKLTRAHSEIMLPSDYHGIYSQVGVNKHLGQDWEIYNFKDLSDIFKKVEGISKAKRIIIIKELVNGKMKIKIKTERFYRSNDDKPFTSLLKKGLKSSSIQLPTTVSLSHLVKPSKLRDINNLLTKFLGNDWQQDEKWDFYKGLVGQSNVNHDRPDQENIDSDECDEDCDCDQSDIALHV